MNYTNVYFIKAIRLPQAPKDAQASVKNLDGAKDSPSISEQPRAHMRYVLNI